MSSLWLKEKNEKLPKPWGTYPLYLGVFPNNSAQRCSNINDARILMRISLKRRRVLLEIDQLTDLHAKEVCTKPLPTESTPAPSPWTPLPSFNDWAQWQLPYMAFEFKCLTLMIEEWLTDAYCIMSLISHIVPYVWQVTARWSTGKSCQRVQFEELESHDQKALWHEISWSFTDLTSVQNRSMCTAEKYSQGQLLRDV